MVHNVGRAGFSLLELVVTLGVGSIVTLALGAVLGLSAQSQGRAMEVIQLDSFREELLRNLSSDEAWANTANDPLNQAAPANMLCLANGTACPASAPPPAAGQPFRLRGPGALAAAPVIWDGTNPSAGLTDKGVICNNFVASPNPGVVFNGNDDCPFRFDLQWYAVCNGANCVNPQVMVTAKLLYNPSATARPLTLNLDRHSINNLYISSGPCSVRSIVFPPGSVGNFPMPNYSRMYVEVWGGGGGAYGGGDFMWAMEVPGTDGGPSSFGAVAAPGGLSMPVGSGPFDANGAWFEVISLPPMSLGGAGPVDGASPPPAVPPPWPSYCTKAIQSGVGGLGAWGNGQPGTSPGGGGGGTIGMNGILVIFSYEPTPGAGAGGYASATWVNGGGGPAPGAMIPYSVGSGGIGGLGAYWMFLMGPLVMAQGGAGGDGLIRITWQ